MATIRAEQGRRHQVACVFAAGHHTGDLQVCPAIAAVQPHRHEGIAPASGEEDAIPVRSEMRTGKAVCTTDDLHPAVAGIRSEEHKSELQSRMRTSYAGFCLKKKKKEQL